MPEAEAFDALIAEFYEVWFHYHPERALALGIPVVGRVLPARDDDDRAALRAWLEELLLALDELDFDALDADRQLDWELLAGAARVEHRELGPGERPDAALLGGSAALLAGLDHAVAARDGGLLLRLLAELPDYLRATQVRSRALLAGLSAAMVRVVAREAQQAGRRLRTLAGGGWRQWCPMPVESLPERLESGARALEAHAEVLSEELAARARGAPGCGAELLGLRLRALHFLDIPALDAPAPGAPECGGSAPNVEPREDHAGLVRALERAADCIARHVDTPDWAGPAVAAGPGGSAPAALRHLPRLLANAATFGDGWPGGQSAGNGSNAPWAGAAGGAEGPEPLLLARLDLDLHTGCCEVREALARLRSAGRDAEGAETLLAGLVRSPGDALAAVLGRQLLVGLGALADPGALGLSGPAARARLAALGPIPLPLALRYAGARAV